MTELDCRQLFESYSNALSKTTREKLIEILLQLNPDVAFLNRIRRSTGNTVGQDIVEYCNDYYGSNLRLVSDHARHILLTALVNNVIYTDYDLDTLKRNSSRYHLRRATLEDLEIVDTSRLRPIPTGELYGNLVSWVAKFIRLGLESEEVYKFVTGASLSDILVLYAYAKRDMNLARRKLQTELVLPNMLYAEYIGELCERSVYINAREAVKLSTLPRSGDVTISVLEETVLKCYHIDLILGREPLEMCEVVKLNDYFTTRYLNGTFLLAYMWDRDALLDIVGMNLPLNALEEYLKCTVDPHIDTLTAKFSEQDTFDIDTVLSQSKKEWH